jgi:hypothetical protein
MIKHYPSIASLAYDWKANGKPKTHTNTSWYNDETADKTFRYAVEGDTSLVPVAENLLSQIDTAIETPRLAWERSPAGAFCIVPDVLAGLPTPMRRQVHVADERAPITILVCSTSSAGVDSVTLQKRGTTVLALTMALARIRPISLKILSILNGYHDRTGETIILADINTTPLDLSTACYVLTSCGFDRRMMHDLSVYHNGFTGGWPKAFNYHNPKTYLDSLPSRLGFDPTNTLIIEPSKLSDYMLKYPIEWVNQQITKFTTNQEENLYA